MSAAASARGIFPLGFHAAGAAAQGMNFESADVAEHRVIFFRNERHRRAASRAIARAGRGWRSRLPFQRGDARFQFGKTLRQRRDGAPQWNLVEELDDVGH